MPSMTMFKSAYRKRVKKDYQRKNSPNPFFRHKAPAPKSHTWRWKIILILAALIFLVWFIFAAPVWRLQDLKITGLTRVPNSEIEKIIYNQSLTKRWLGLVESNIFLFDSAAATKQIKTVYNLADLKITKSLPHTLELLVSERPYAFIFQEGSAQYYASSDGYIIRQPAVAVSDTKKYFTLENKNAGTLIGSDDKINISADYLQFIFNLETTLSNHQDLPVERFIIDQEFNTIKVKFTNGPLVYFNIKDSADSQVNVLLLVKKEKIKDNFSKTNYIDLRYGNRVFINPDFN
jgi:cell division septal protein FtsQ